MWTERQVIELLERGAHRRRRNDALVLGCAEELLGYLPTRGDISRGTYAALESTFLYKRLPVVPGEAERLGEEMGRALERVLS